MALRIGFLDGERFAQLVFRHDFGFDEYLAKGTFLTTRPRPFHLLRGIRGVILLWDLGRRGGRCAAIRSLLEGMELRTCLFCVLERFGELLKAVKNNFQEARGFHTKNTRRGSRERYIVGRGYQPKRTAPKDAPKEGS